MIIVVVDVEKIQIVVFFMIWRLYSWEVMIIRMILVVGVVDLETRYINKYKLLIVVVDLEKIQRDIVGDDLETP